MDHRKDGSISLLLYHKKLDLLDWPTLYYCCVCRDITEVYEIVSNMRKHFFSFIQWWKEIHILASVTKQVMVEHWMDYLLYTQAFDSWSVTYCKCHICQKLWKTKLRILEAAVYSIYTVYIWCRRRAGVSLSFKMHTHVVI